MLIQIRKVCHSIRISAMIADILISLTILGTSIKMREVIRFTNTAGEVNFGLILSWHDGRRDMAEVFWDTFRHPKVPPARVVYQCTVPHEREPEIAFFPVKKQLDGTKTEILPAKYAKINWSCKDIAFLESSEDIVSAMNEIGAIKYRKANAGRFVEKEFGKHAAVAKEAANDDDS